MDLRETEWGDMDWIDLGQDRDQWRALVNMVLNLQVPCNSGKLRNCTTGNFSRRELHEVSHSVSQSSYFMPYSGHSLVTLIFCPLGVLERANRR
jgi:hypothetical protein